MYIMKYADTKKNEGEFYTSSYGQGSKILLRFQKINVMREYRTCNIAKHEA